MNRYIRSTITALLIFLTAFAAFAGDKVTYYHNDALGSPVAPTNARSGDLARNL